ncbi:Protein of unknown function DUF1772 [Plasmopara halstedii]|uniref:Uncharacterized protein n=1 Tax=Plasmopara halstedii TaxID=4781 RepID=A0A0N7L5R5_PLAHL|nr:Protein of unknown function DUF1772 [Plasmopara halstedii]CEG42211.1 Protein of unknown function DUF1772 [Plasmopara halstedii]|eukprot:XP_024578580.1 Protein of unknown function DUF1772 [Plasmopara halstedii]
MQGPLSLGSGLSAVLVAYLQSKRGPHAGMPRLWLSSGCLIGAVVPFTVIKMLTLNNKLVDSKSCVHRGQSWMRIMLRRWGKLHSVRAGASVLAYTGMLVAMACGGDRTSNDSSQNLINATSGKGKSCWDSVASSFSQIYELHLASVVEIPKNESVFSFHLAKERKHRICAHDAHTYISKLIQQCCIQLFVDAPAQLHRALVNFNQWLAEKLQDTQSGSDQGPEQNKVLSLSLEEPHDQTQSLDVAVTAVSSSPTQSIKTNCKLNMVRCNSLQHIDVNFQTQAKDLEENLKMHFRSFELQKSLERQQEVRSLQSRCHVTENQDLGSYNQNLFGPRLPHAMQTADEVSSPRKRRQSALANVPDFGMNEKSAANYSSKSSEDVTDFEEDGVDGVDYRNQNIRLHRQKPSEDTRYSQSPDFVGKSFPECDNGDYQHLLELQGNEENNRRWYQQALHSLNVNREQRRLLLKSRTKTANRPITSFSSYLVKEATYDAHEFLRLVSFRESNKDGEDLTWYRRALQHLKNERIHCEGSRDRDSVASTVSIVD